MIKNNVNSRLFNYISGLFPFAEARIEGGEDYPNIRGITQFYNMPNGILVVTDVENLPSTLTNIFAIHIHQRGDCSNNFENTGEHYNPNLEPHPRHAGDMPPLFSNNGSAWSAFLTNRFNRNEIIGKSVIIHDSFDDFMTQPSGNPGRKIACGEIKRIN